CGDDLRLNLPIFSAPSPCSRTYFRYRTRIWAHGDAIVHLPERQHAGLTRMGGPNQGWGFSEHGPAVPLHPFFLAS
ncbi:hypothetical protein PUNSTDRAFT_49757, partial [Punctularia strigosozonata HHB-11173 SS5]|uniref:uncharacterized protein n=1 Tax=Punctularia strigosozonata (strain HHB-11173) TaxID=741275 RepID=UPI0004417F52